MKNPGERLERNPRIRLHPLDDGTAIAAESGGEAYALNADAAAAWEAKSDWTAAEMTAWLRERGMAKGIAETAAQGFLEQLQEIGLYTAPGSPAEAAATSERRIVAHYRIWRSTMRLITNDPVVAEAVEEVCSQFRSDGADDVIEFEVQRCPDHGWHIEREGRRLHTTVLAEDATTEEERARARDAAAEAEFQMIDTAVIEEREFVHWHGSGLALDGRAVLIPGRGRSGKTTLSLAMAVDGFRLLGEDVLFLEPATQMVHPLHRSILLRKGGAARCGSALAGPGGDGGRLDADQRDRELAGGAGPFGDGAARRLR